MDYLNVSFFGRKLSDNQLTCDCNLHGVYDASRRLSVFTGSCYKPDGLRDNNIKSLKPGDLCRECLGG